MNWRPTARLLDWTIPVGFGVILCLAAPLRTALEFGGDEGYELMKAFLVSLGHPLYRELWNDQPPLHTELLALLFRVFGPSAFVGRLLAVGFAMLLVASLFQVVRNHSGRLAGLVAVGLLVSSSVFIHLSVSVMIELPAMALAMAAVWASTAYYAGKGKHWLVFSGVIFGCALQVKLTAVLFLPALAAEYLANWIGRNKAVDGSTARARFWDAALWCGAVLAAFGFFLVVFYRLDALSMFWVSHFSTAARNAVASEEYGFRPESLLNDLGMLAPAAVGVALIGWKWRWDLLLPVVLFGTTLGTHLWHRPYWYYYALHFSIPMAWLGAVGIVEWFRAIWKQDLRASLATKLRVGIGWLGWSMVVSLVLTLAPEKAWNELGRLSAALPAGEDPRVIALRKHAAQTRWVFTDGAIYAFWAGLPVPPEFAVIIWKRIWSGQINEREIMQCLDRYRPEQILLLSRWKDSSVLSDYLNLNYQADPEVVGLYMRQR
jgi:dolichyl-phosphate-mannose-protein mannosyltransferase